MIYADTHLPPLLSFDLSVIAQAIVDSAKLIIAIYMPLTIILFLSIYKILTKRQAINSRLFVLTFSLFWGHTLLVRNKFVYYAIYITPLLDLLITTYIYEIFKKQKAGLQIKFDKVQRSNNKNSWRIVGNIISQALIWGIFAGTMILNLRSLLLNYQIEFKQTENQLKQVIQPGDTIIGPQTFWFTFNKFDYYSWEQLVYYRRYWKDASLEEAFKAIRPNIYIQDGGIEFFISESAKGLYANQMSIPKQELQEFLKNNGILLASHYDENYGNILVYRIILSE